MKKYSRFFSIMLIIVLLSSIIALIPPICLQVWDSMQIQLTGTRVGLVIAIVASTNILNIILVVYRERFAKSFNEKNLISLMADFLRMDYDEINTEGPSNLLEKMVSSINNIYIYMTGLHIQIWSSIIVATVSIVLIARINIILGLAMLVYVPISYFGFKLINKELSRRSQELQKQTGLGFQELMSYIQVPDYYKQLPDHYEILAKMKPSIQRIYKTMARVNQFAQSSSIAIEGFGSIIQNFILMVMVYSFCNNVVSPHMLMITTIVLPLYFSAITTITNSNINKKDYDVAIQLHKEISKKKERDARGEINNIETLTFSVNKLKIDNKEIPFYANTTLAKGDIARIAGKSGSGKSTFAKTLVKFREIVGVKINGIEISEISNEAIRSKVEYVSQNIPIIRGTLRDNLSFGKNVDSIPDSFYLNHPLLKSILSNKKLDDHILEGGANLSGGEKQKIAIVRATLCNPEVLILDEVCSNIDAHASNDIYEILKKERAKRITIIITHDNLPEDFANIEING